jgi:hypothetical protein
MGVRGKFLAALGLGAETPQYAPSLFAQVFKELIRPGAVCVPYFYVDDWGVVKSRDFGA